MRASHSDRVAALLRDGAQAHAMLRANLSAELRASLPVDGQGLTHAIDYLAQAAGFSVDQRRALVTPHAVNPAVLHARVYGRAPLTEATVIGAFVDGARVRADALAVLADTIGGEALGAEIRTMLVEHPPPVEPEDPGAVAALRATYAAQDRAAVAIAASLDTR